MKYLSRINKIFTSEFLDKMFDLYKQHKFYVTKPDGSKVRVDDVRHMKALKFRELLSNYFEENKISYTFLGDGTNRMSFLVDGYVFKLALDDQGYIDNLTEFKMSKEAQPYVTKTYETNGLFCVAEYVTLISYDEFVKQKYRILEILEILSSEYLLGDMGWTKKNYCNWGYRKNSKDLVILDYGHMLKIDSDKLICQDCGGFLAYNSTYTEIECISCNKKTDFMNIKSRISKREEIEMIDRYLDNSVNTDKDQVDVEEEVVQEHKVQYDYEPDEIVSNRFEMFKPEKKRTFADMMDDEEDDYEEDEDDNKYDFQAALSLLNDYDKPVQKQSKQSPNIPPEIAKINDSVLRQLLLVDRDEAELTLSQGIVTGRFTNKEYNYYMTRLEDYYNNQKKVKYDENDYDDEDDNIATVGEVLQSKMKDVSKQDTIEVNEDSDDDYEYYGDLLNHMENENKEPDEDDSFEMNYSNLYNMNDENEEEPQDNDMIEQMNQVVANLMYIDEDDDGGGMYPEDFLNQNLANLGFDEEDSEEDVMAYDAVLANIRKGNHVDLDELEDMLDDEEDDEDNVEDAYMATLEVFYPNPELEVKEENKQQDIAKNDTVDLKYESDTNSVFKVRRTNNQTPTINMNQDNESLSTKSVKKDSNEGIVVNDPKEKYDEYDNESLMSKAFKNMNKN